MVEMRSSRLKRGASVRMLLEACDFSRVRLHTKIWVRESEKLKWHPRYFAKYKNDKVYAWDDGATSFSVGGGQSCTSWKYAKLAEKE